MREIRGDRLRRKTAAYAGSTERTLTSPSEIQDAWNEDEITGKHLGEKKNLQPTEVTLGSHGRQDWKSHSLHSHCPPTMSPSHSDEVTALS